MVIEIDEPEPRSMPVLVLADTSGSMAQDGKIEVLNDAIHRMITAFADLRIPGCEVTVAIIAFGGEEARVHIPVTSAADIEWAPLAAEGRTPMGRAFEVARSLLEDPEVISPRSYRPNLVLVSDGIPTDDWQSPLEGLQEAQHSQRALRFAIGIGADAKNDVLLQFAGDQGEVVPAEHVEMLTEFFEFVTYAATASIHQPNQAQGDIATFENFTPGSHPEF